MLFRDELYLVTITFSTNSLGDITETPTEALVYANKKSIRQSEFYQAAATGLKPEAMFEVRSIDYADQERLKFDGKYYDIIRSYSKNGEITELICTRLVNKSILTESFLVDSNGLKIFDSQNNLISVVI